MAAYTLEPQFAAYDASRTALYYWTNVYCWLQPDPSSGPDAGIVAALESATWALAAQNATRGLYRVRQLGGGYETTVSDPQRGSYGFVRGHYQFGSIARVVGYDAHNRAIAYKRLRGCWGYGDVAGGTLSDGLYNYLTSQITATLAHLPLCNLRSQIIDHWVVERRVREWQQRHGSKRAVRPVIAIP